MCGYGGPPYSAAMRPHRPVIARVCVCVALLSGLSRAAWAVDPVTLVSASGYGNFHAGGVVVTISGDDNRNGSAALEWRPTTGVFKAGHPLTRIDATHFVGSLFWLSPGTTYEARVTLSDPEGVSGSATVITTVQTRVDSLPEPTVRTLYVSTTGSDSNAGTSPGLPVQTIQRAATLSQAGDLILINPGVYRETVSVPRSGTASQPIVFRGTSAGVILDGADGAIAGGVTWTPQPNGVHSRVTGFATGHVVTDAGRLYKYGSLANLTALSVGPPGGFFFDGTTLSVKFSDGSAPSAHTMHVARREDGFFIDGRSFVRIENLEIRHFGVTDFGKGVYLRYSSDCTVKGSRIHDIEAAGVWVKGGDRHRLEDNELSDTSISGWPWSSVKLSTAENNGISFTDDVGRGHVVRRNTFHGTFNGIGPCGSAAPPLSGLTNEMDLYQNVLYDHTDDAFEPEGYCSNMRFWDNYVHDVHMAFAVAPAAPGPVYFVRNVAYRFGNTRTSLVDGATASALKINSGYSTPVGPVYLYHNTLLTDVPSTHAISLLNPGFSTFIRLRNNVVAGTRYALAKINPVVWDGNYDDFYTTDPTRLVWWEGTRYDTLAAYRASQGQELQGLSAPPQLVNPAGGNFAPQPGSPLVDAGLFIPGINDGFSGGAPDVGAYELALTLSIGDASVVEGNSGPANVVFPVTLSAASSATVTVNYATAAQTASSGVDYTLTSGSLSFNAGVTTRTVTVPAIGDGAVEPNETFLVNLSGPVNATLADGQGIGTIIDDDAAITDPATVYRLRHPSIGAYLFTVYPFERDSAQLQYGYVFEGNCCKWFVSSAADGRVPLYRLFSSSAGEYFFTIYASERDSAVAQFGYVFEGVAAYCHPASTPAAPTPWYRLRFGNKHLYTIYASERDSAVSQFGYTFEGVSCFLPPP